MPKWHKVVTPLTNKFHIWGKKQDPPKNFLEKFLLKNGPLMFEFEGRGVKTELPKFFFLNLH